jgi:hypothetical protein
MVKEDFSEIFICFFWILFVSCFAVLGLNAVLDLGGRGVGLQ